MPVRKAGRTGKMPVLHFCPTLAPTHPPGPAVRDSSTRLALVATILGVLIAGWWAGRVAYGENHHEDLWIYTSGAAFGLRGESPYDTPKMHARVAEQFDDDDLIQNNGFFLTPQAILVFAPWGLLPWVVAKLLWCALTIGLSAAVGWKLRSFVSGAFPPWFTAAAVVVVLCNPLSLFVLIVGQTTLLVVACAVLGQAAHNAGWRRLGALVWAIAFIKPHLAIPLLPLAWFLSGWRRPVEILAWVTGLNLFAGLVVTGSPLFVLDYLAYLQQGHQSVEFNRVGVNKQITAWNRLVVANGGPVWELGMLGTLLGYAVWFALVAVRMGCTSRQRERLTDPEFPAHPDAGTVRRSRCRLIGCHPTSPSWALAACAVGAPLCCQLLPYELPLLVLVLPYLGELLASENPRDQLAALFVAAFGTFALLPGGEGSLAENFADTFGFTMGIREVLMSHRALGVACLAGTVWVHGSPTGRHRPKPRVRGLPNSGRRGAPVAPFTGLASFRPAVDGGESHAIRVGGGASHSAICGAGINGAPSWKTGPSGSRIAFCGVTKTTPGRCRFTAFDFIVVNVAMMTRFPFWMRCAPAPLTQTTPLPRSPERA